MNDKLDPNKEFNLDYFLTKNNTTPPAPRAGEKERILQTLILSTKSKPAIQQNGVIRFFKGFQSHLKWITPVAAAAMIGFFTLVHYLPQDKPTERISDAEMSAYLEETLGGFYNDSYVDENVASVSDQYYYLADYVE